MLHNPQAAKAYYWRGIASTTLRKLKEAKTAFEKSSSLRADYPATYWRLALVNLDLGDSQNALEMVDRAAQLSPMDGNVALVRAKALLMVSRAEETLELLDSFDFMRLPMPVTLDS